MASALAGWSRVVLDPPGDAFVAWMPTTPFGDAGRTTATRVSR
jgi:hypothetical protein